MQIWGAVPWAVDGELICQLHAVLLGHVLAYNVPFKYFFFILHLLTLLCSSDFM